MALAMQSTKAARVSAGATESAESLELTQLAERAALNRLLGLPPRQFYPAFRVSIEQVHAASAELLAGHRYAAEKILYPHPKRCDGLSVLGQILTADMSEQ